MTGAHALVVDASAVVTALVDPGDAGEWVAEQLQGKTLFAPELCQYEAANILRRHYLRGVIDQTAANSSYQDLLDMPIHLEPFSVVAGRVWELRDNVTSYDASYVAVAEWRRAPLLTADAKLARSSGPRCPFVTPPDDLNWKS
jgi:predicted nucleic acid-binding protein